MAPSEIAVAFLQLAAAGRVDEAWQHVGPGFRHHNPYFAGDGASLKRAMAEASAAEPNKALEVQHVVAEGALVAVHSRLVRVEGPVIGVVHLLRFEGGLIAELWDVGQVIPADSPNQHGAF